MRKKLNTIRIENCARILSNKTDIPCYYCIRKTSKGNGLTKDHIIPKSLGGSDSDKNIVYSCLDCNRFKANKMPLQWFTEISEMIEGKIPLNKNYNIITLGQIRKSLKNTINKINISELIK